MKTKLALIVVIALAPLPAAAATLTLGSGWTSDTLSSVPGPTDNSPWTFTVASGAHFSLTDDFVTGDTYTVTGSINGTSTFYAGANDVRATGANGSAWLSASYSKFSTYVGPGTYTFDVTGDGVGGVPAGLGLRLDSTVPEPTSWAMMIAGFGLVGAAMRRRATAIA